MARKPRIHSTGAVYHVMLRGNAGQAIFFVPKDYSIFVRIPEYGKSKHLRNEPIKDVSEISKHICNYYQATESSISVGNRSHIASKIRSLVALLYTEQSGAISRVAEYFDKDISTVSKNLNKFKQKLLVDDHLQQEVEALKNPKIQA